MTNHLKGAGNKTMSIKYDELEQKRDMLLAELENCDDAIRFMQIEDSIDLIEGELSELDPFDDED